MFKRIMIASALAVVVLTLSIGAQAQTKAGAANPRAGLMELVQRAREGRSAANLDTVAIVKDAYRGAVQGGEASLQNGNIVGTWNVLIPASDGGGAPFEALQTFGADGTFVETSSLLGTGGEGPAHGAWYPTTGGFILSFELFVFDPATGESVGRVRVRNYLQINDRRSNRFFSFQAVDFIEPDGNVIENIDTGTFSGTRLMALGID